MSRSSLLKESRSEYREYIPSAILHSKQFIDESSSQSSLPAIIAFRIRMSEEMIHIVETINQLAIRHAMVNSSGMLLTFEIAIGKNPKMLLTSQSWVDKSFSQVIYWWNQRCIRSGMWNKLYGYHINMLLFDFDVTHFWVREKWYYYLVTSWRALFLSIKG